MQKMPIKLIDNTDAYQLEIPKSVFDRIPNFNGNEIFSSFSATGLVLTGTNPERDDELQLISHIIHKNNKALEELDD